MTERPVARSSRGWLRQQKQNDDRRLVDRMIKSAVVMMSEVSDDRADQRHDPADSCKVPVEAL